MAGGSLGKLFVSLGIDTSGLSRGLDKAKTDIGGLSGVVAKHGTAIGAAMTGIGVVSVLASKKFRDSFMAIDTAMAGVRKTTGMTKVEIADMKDAFVDLSKEMPSAAAELANIGQIAGQLGITGKASILSFTEDIAKMSVAFDMSAEDAATAMAKMAKIYKIPIDRVDNLGSAINVLGNTTAATESQIMAYSMTLGAVADTMGFTATESLAVGATLVSMGQDASRAGTGINSALTFISKDSATAAAAMGMTEAAFGRAFGNDPMQMIIALAEQLGTIQDPLERNALAVDVFGNYGAKAMVALSADIDGLKTNLDASAEGFDQNVSLTEEYANATDTLAAKLQMVKNRQEAAAMTLGEAMAPATLLVANATAALADGISALPGPLQTATGLTLALGQSFTVLGPLLMGASMAMNAMKVTTFSAVIPALTAHAVAAWAAISPYLIFIAPVVAVIAILAALELKFGLVTKTIQFATGVLSSMVAGFEASLGSTDALAAATEDVSKGVEEEGRLMGVAEVAADALADAQKNVADSAAEVDTLTSAYEELQGAISDALGLTEDADDQARAVEHAVFGLEDAEKKYAAAVEEHGANSTEAAKADLRRRDAIDRLDDAEKKQIKITEEIAAADTKKTGILEANGVKTLKGFEDLLSDKESEHDNYLAKEIVAEQSHTDTIGTLTEHRADMEIKEQKRVEQESISSWSRIMSTLKGMDAFGAGKALMVALADGVKSGITNAVEAVKTAAGKVMEYFPFSDAKRGPLSNITASGAALMETFGKGMAASNIDLSHTVDHILPQPIMAASPAAPATASSSTTNSSSVSMGDVHLSNDFDFMALMAQIDRYQATKRTQRGVV